MFTSCLKVRAQLESLVAKFRITASSVNPSKWRTECVEMAQVKFRDRRITFLIGGSPPSGSKFFHFHAVFGKKFAK